MPDGCGRKRASRSLPPSLCDVPPGRIDAVIAMLGGAIAVVGSSKTTMSYHLEDGRVQECTYDLQTDEGVYRIIADDSIAVTMDIDAGTATGDNRHGSIRVDIRMMRADMGVDAIMPHGVSARMRRVQDILRRTSGQSRHRLAAAQAAMTRAAETCCAYASLEGSPGGSVRLTAPVPGRGPVVDWRPDRMDPTDMKPIMSWARETMLPVVRIADAGNDVDVAIIVEPLRMLLRYDDDPVTTLRSAHLVPEGLRR
jgi:hypothetical protein